MYWPHRDSGLWGPRGRGALDLGGFEGVVGLLGGLTLPAIAGRLTLGLAV